MTKKQQWLMLGEKCDNARDEMCRARDAGECTDELWDAYQTARKLEHEAYFDYLNN